LRQYLLGLGVLPPHLLPGTRVHCADCDGLVRFLIGDSINFEFLTLDGIGAGGIFL
jgi:hypothetical protein